MKLPFNSNNVIEKIFKSFNAFWTGFILLNYVFIAGLLFLRSTRPAYSEKYIFTYALGDVVSVIGLIVFAGLGVWNWWQKKQNETEAKIIRLGFVSESSPELPLSNGYKGKGVVTTKFIVILVFTIIVAASAMGGLQIFGDPSPYANIETFSSTGQALASEKVGLIDSLIDTAYIPALTEDMASLMLSAFLTSIPLLILFILHKITKKNIFKFNAIWLWCILPFTCGLSALYFSQAHEGVAAGNVLFFFAAWLFQTCNLLVMWVVGFFFPLPHFTHNAIFVLGFSVAYSVALASIPLYLIFIKIKCQKK